VTRVVLHRLATSKRALDACRLLERLFGEGKRVLVYFTDEARARTFDEYLWTFSQSSFVGHSLWDGRSEIDDRIVLALRTLARPNGATVLVLVDSLEDLDGARAFEEVHDFVTPLPEDQDRAERWKAAGYEVS